MPVMRGPERGHFLEVLDRVLDKGLVVDAWARVSLLGLDLSVSRTRLVVASIELYVDYVEVVENTSEPRSVLPILKEPIEDWSAVDDAYPFPRTTSR
jgi:gas vesicle structural protein